MATVVVQFGEDGTINYAVSGDAQLFIVDERAPNDRVYEYTTRTDPSVIEELIAGEVGHQGDARHAALKHQIEARLNGESPLRSV